MGQVISRRAARHSSPHPSSEHEGDKSSFMNLPLDLVLHISRSFLDPVSALALSLTCKGMTEATFTRSLLRLRPSHLQDFLLLLEKDMSHHRPTYYCHTCIRLHAFDPASESPNASGYRRALETYCRNNSLYLHKGSLTISYPHARLIMNEHLYGAGHGLPLSTLDVTYRTGYYKPLWEQKWLAMVINNELILSAQHRLQFEGTADDFGSIINDREHEICAHVGVRRYPDKGQREHDDKLHTYRQSLRDLQNQRLQIAGEVPVPQYVYFNPPWGCSRSIDCFRRKDDASSLHRDQSLRECREVPGSCIFCATDYTTTLEKTIIRDRRGLKQERWVLTIKTYHELGSCRSPSDPKWEAFRYQVLTDSEPGREALGPLPREVKAKWEAAAEIATRN